MATQAGDFSGKSQARAASSDDAKNFGALVASFAKAQNAGKSDDA